MNRNIRLLYGFAFFNPFMIVIPVWVPYLATHGITMRQFMELQAVFAIVILCGEVPSGLLSDLWGRKKTLLLGSTLKAVSFSLLPLWTSSEGFLFYHLTMGIALSMISGGDVALLYDSHLAAGGEKARGTSLLGNMKFAGQTGAAVSGLLGGAVVALSYGHLLWANAILSWIPTLLVLGVTEPPAVREKTKKRSEDFKEVLSTTLVRDGTTRLVFLNLVALGAAGLVMVWTRQKYWQDIGVSLAYFGMLDAGYTLLVGFAGRSAARASATYGRRPLLAAVGVLPIIAYFGMAAFFGWPGIVFGLLIQISRGLGDVLFMHALNERITSAFRATVISMTQVGVRGSFALAGPLVGYGIDVWGLPSVLSALGILFSIAFVVLLLPLILRDTTPRPTQETTMATTVPAWTIDPVHSSVEFSLDYMGFSTYRTGFRALDGSLAFDPARPAASSVTASIPVATIDVTNDRLMSRLMDPDLFGGKDHPTITFKSAHVEALDPAHWKVSGDLTIHGVTRPVVLDTRYLGQAQHPFSKKIAAAFRAETAIDRRDFGVTWNAVMDTGGAYLGEQVQISLSIMALRQD